MFHSESDRQYVPLNQKKMKKLFLLYAVGLFTGISALQAQHLEFQSGPADDRYHSLFEKITHLEKKTDMFNLYLNMQGSFNIYLNQGEVKETSFRMEQLRLEMKGNVTNRIYYRYRQRLNVNNTAEKLDNLPNSIDYAAIGYHITDRFSLFAGKQCTAFGGIEFDLNPIQVYQYGNLSEHMHSFATGVDLSYWVTPTQEFRFQILNSRNSSFESFYGKVPDNIKANKAPLGYTLNWNGNFWDKMLQTRWSASIYHEAKKKNWYYYALGTKVNLSRFSGFFDFIYTTENIDRTGIISEITATDEYTTRALYTRYMSLILHLNYRITPKFNLFAKGNYETASVQKANQQLEKGKYQTSWVYLGGIEYYPMEENLHFFLCYVGRTFDYTTRAEIFGVGDSSPQRVEFGFVYQLPMF